ncbi:Diphthamide biosynthesis protein 4 [[Candida] zeylanoides]|jgi:diphthamide biosynthesis protein 4
MDAYAVLGVPPDATDHEVRRAYRQRMLEVHPDKRRGGSEDAAAVAAIQAAYHALDPQRRHAHDAARHDTPADGLDTYSLASFSYDGRWTRPCPRCHAPAIVLTERDLERGTDDGEGGLAVAVQCGSCSLWIKVHYVEQ